MNKKLLQSCLSISIEALEIGSSVDEFDLTNQVLPTVFNTLDSEDWFSNFDIRKTCKSFQSTDIEQWKLMLNILSYCLSILNDWNVDEVEIDTEIPEGFGETKYDEDDEMHETSLISKCLLNISQNL